ncbi:MAG: hypothetical protein HYV27_07520 [Candidatus Hydrogenedentes bacterium]|nr:hypothetical protein [Candidatus Hydrogenedentota bacterium]
MNYLPAVSALLIALMTLMSACRPAAEPAQAPPPADLAAPEPVEAPGQAAAPLQAEDSAEAHEHTHAAPHGGTLIALGEHEANLEAVLSPAEGKVDLYVLDGHAENPVRLTNPGLPAQVKPEGGAPVAILLEAVANPLTGETVGDTSAFSAVIPELKGASGFALSIPNLGVRGEIYEVIEVAIGVLTAPQASP